MTRARFQCPALLIPFIALHKTAIEIYRSIDDFRCRCQNWPFHTICDIRATYFVLFLSDFLIFQKFWSNYGWKWIGYELLYSYTDTVRILNTHLQIRSISFSLRTPTVGQGCDVFIPR